MKLVTVESFLTRGSAPTPNGKWRAVAIHPSSEVDLVMVGGALLPVGSVVPFAPSIEAVRLSCGATGVSGAAADGRHVVGETLVLALYEDCDPLVPLGPRVPSFRDWIVVDEDLPETAATALLVMRIPFQGRRNATITFNRDDPNFDMTVQVIGRKIAPRTGATINSPLAPPGIHLFVPSDPQTWFVGGAPPVMLNLSGSRQFNIENEGYDELQVYAWGEATTGGSCYFLGEANGEWVNG